MSPAQMDLAIRILTVVRMEFSLKLYDLESRPHPARLVWPRQLTYWLLREHAKMTLEHIGSFMNRHHSGIFFALQRCKARLQTEEMARQDLARLEGLLGIEGSGPFRVGLASMKGLAA